MNVLSLTRMTLVCCFLAPSAWAVSLEDSLLTYMAKGDRGAVFRLAREKKQRCEFVTGYAGLLKERRESPPRTDSILRFGREISTLLASNAIAACSDSYLQVLEDTTVPEIARTAAFQALEARTARFASEKQTAILAAEKRVLAKSSTPAKLKAKNLVDWSRIAPREGTQILFAELAANDAQVREAAFHGLANRVKGNRHGKRFSENRAIFDSLLHRDSLSQNLDQVRVIATIGEGYARDYLLTACATNCSP